METGKERDQRLARHLLTRLFLHDNGSCRRLQPAELRCVSPCPDTQSSFLSGRDIRPARFMYLPEQQRRFLLNLAWTSTELCSTSEAKTVTLSSLHSFFSSHQHDSKSCYHSRSKPPPPPQTTSTKASPQQSSPSSTSFLSSSKFSSSNTPYHLQPPRILSLPT